MNQFKSLLFFALCWLLSMPVEAKKEHLLPLPKEVQAQPGVFLHYDVGTPITVTGIAGHPSLTRFFNEFGITDVTFDEKGNGGQVQVSLVKSIPGTFDHKVNAYENEAYTLEVTASGIRISAVTPLGVTRAAQTLTQLAEGYAEKGVNLEGVSVKDWPAFKVRGFMHDVGRSFISFEELKNEINLLSRFKVNVFHWHLTEKLAWRFEVKEYPQLTANKHMIRYPGKFYTQDECKQLVDYAAERGVMVIPEIDMPGHSDVFTKAMGFDMQSPKGIEALKKILDEVVVVFEKSPYIHIGGDEVSIRDPKYLENMADYVRAKGKKVVMWNQLVAGAPTAKQCDMTQMWATRGRAVNGLPNIDCRYNYTNHFDVYADLVGIYKSNIYYEQRGTAQVAGTISAAWNDTKTLTENDIVCQNNIYANIIASAERAWKGGGKQYVEVGGTALPNSGEEFDEFADFERRFLFHKDHSLKDAPIAYVRQSNVRWRVTDPFPNGGKNDIQLPPEKADDEILPDHFEYQGNTYGTRIATGAGIYLRHIWHPTIPSFFSNPGNNQTAYAWTYVYSEKEQKVGAQIEFYTYSRSGNEKAPVPGQWDRRGSKVWLNGQEIEAPQWKRANASIPQDHATLGLTNENLTARDVVPLTLKAGWNKVFMRLPHVNNGGTGRDKWQFTFVFTTPDGKHAVDGLIYSPNKCMDEAAEKVAAAVSEVKTFRNSMVKDQPGYYAPSAAAALDAKIKAIEATYSQKMTAEERNQQIEALKAELDAFKKGLAQANPLQPIISTPEKTVFYTLSTPLRENRYASSKGVNADMVGETTADKSSFWKFVTRQDGALDIVNYNGTFVSPNSAFNTALKTQKASPEKGWKLDKADETGYFILTSGSVQFNQTGNSQLGYKVYNWGSGTNKNDAGCKYVIKEVNLEDFQIDPNLPEVGKNYYFFNKHQGGDQYFYDNNGSVGFGAQKMEKYQSYVWTCLDAGNGNFYFKNLKTGKYFAWKSLSTTACPWKLNSKVNVTNAGCVTMQAVQVNGSNFMVCKRNAFDQANRGGFYDATFSSDFKFELCSNTEWEDEVPEEPVSYYSKKFGDNWVRLIWDRNTADAAGLVSTTGNFQDQAAKSNASDMTAKDQLWALVGTAEGFYLQNAAAGEQWALHVSTTAEAAEAKLVNKASACKWVLVDQGGSFAITPASNRNMSLNSFGGARMNLKLYQAGDGGSKWRLQPNLVEGLKMATVIEGENPYGDQQVTAGELVFAVDGVATKTTVVSDATGEQTYYLPAKANVKLTQGTGFRGFAPSGFEANGKTAESLQFKVGDLMQNVKVFFKADLNNGLVLYRTPDANGYPYRIPAIATAKNGDLFAISDVRPCRRDIGYGEVDIKCRMSKDNGKTWGPEFFVANGLGDNNGGQVWKTGFGDAAFVADAERNELLVMMVCGKTVCWDGNYIPNSPQSNPNRVAQVRAKLNEQTGEWEWTEPKEVTESVYSIFVENGNATVKSLFIGSGRICQSRVTKVGDYYRLYCAVWTKNEGNRVIYSDDFGKTWKVLGKISDRPGKGGDEPKCEEMPDGSVILSSRRNGRLFNIYTYTDPKTGAGSWQTEQWSENQPNGIQVGNSTNGEILILKAIRKADQQKVDLALQSVPFGNVRRDVGLYYKALKTEDYHDAQKLASNWTKGLQVSHDFSAYSTMTLQKDHKIGFYFEEAPGEYCMVYIPLTLERITNDQFSLDEDAYQTGIGEVIVDSAAEQTVYDLSGRRVAQPEHGVYIINGHKVLVK